MKCGECKQEKLIIDLVMSESKSGVDATCINCISKS